MSLDKKLWKEIQKLRAEGLDKKEAVKKVLKKKEPVKKAVKKVLKKRVK